MRGTILSTSRSGAGSSRCSGSEIIIRHRGEDNDTIQDFLGMHKIVKRKDRTFIKTFVTEWSPRRRRRIPSERGRESIDGPQADYERV